MHERDMLLAGVNLFVIAEKRLGECFKTNAKKE